MNILATQFSLANRTLEIYLAGCAGPHCEQCHNPESWDFNAGKDWKEYTLDILYKIESFDLLIDNIWILGGEPLDHPEKELEPFLKMLRDTGKKIWLFTGKDKSEVPKSVKTHLDILKCGRYIPGMVPRKVKWAGITLASNNQRLYRLNKEAA